MKRKLTLALTLLGLSLSAKAATPCLTNVTLWASYDQCSNSAYCVEVKLFYYNDSCVGYYDDLPELCAPPTLDWQLSGCIFNWGKTNFTNCSVPFNHNTFLHSGGYIQLSRLSTCCESYIDVCQFKIQHSDGTGANYTLDMNPYESVVRWYPIWETNTSYTCYGNLYLCKEKVAGCIHEGQ